MIDDTTIHAMMAAVAHPDAALVILEDAKIFSSALAQILAVWGNLTAIHTSVTTQDNYNYKTNVITSRIHMYSIINITVVP